MPKKRDHGQGGLYSYRRAVRRKDGSVVTHTYYRGVVDLGFDTEGKRVQKYVTATTKSAAKTKLDALQKEIRDHGAPLNKQVTVEAWAQTWLATIVKPSVDPNTYTTYRAQVNKRIVPILGRKKVSTLKPSDIHAVLQSVRDAGLSTSTGKQAHQAMSGMLEAARIEGLCRANVAADVKAPRQGESTRSAFETSQALAILAKAAAMPDSAGSRWWFKLLGGPRQGEILGARLEDLDLSAGLYTVWWKLEHLTREHGCGADGAPLCGGKRGVDCPEARWRVPDGFMKEQIDGAWHLTRPKSKPGRVVPLIPQLVEAIRRHIEATKEWPNPHGLIWRNRDGSPILPVDDGQQWRDLLQSAGVITAEENKPGGTALTGHCARHTTVTILASLGVDHQLIGEIVGHSSTKVTEMYRHARAEEKAAAMAKLGGAWASALGAVVEPAEAVQIEA